MRIYFNDHSKQWQTFLPIKFLKLHCSYAILIKCLTICLTVQSYRFINMTDFHNSKIKDHLIHKYIKEHTPESKNVHLNQRMYTRMYTWIKECTPELS